MEALDLLTADHNRVRGLFTRFQAAEENPGEMATLAQKIITELEVHTQIEEEIFYPAFLEATQEEDIHHEAEVEHNGAKRLIAEIEASGPDDDYYDAKVKVLSEMITHHVNEEEKRDGMFAKARKSEMDLEALGERLAARKAELMEEASGDGASGLARSRRSRTSSHVPH